jgi:hypothetical protein
MAPWRLISVGLLFLSFFDAFATSLRTPRAWVHDMVTIKVSAEPLRLTLHEPVLLILEIRNDSRESMHIDLGKDRKENFLFAITPPGGGRIQLPQLRRSGFGRGGNVEIAGGDEYSQSIVLNEWYDFNEIGSYDIEMRFAKLVFTGDEVVGAREHFELRFDIGVRSEEVLMKRCEALVAGIESSNSYERWSEGALALSYIKDPIAIPYLKKILGANKLVEPTAILGLERIGTPEAARALSSGLEITTNHASTLAKAALLRMESATSDPQMKQEIRRIVGESANPG